MRNSVQVGIFTPWQTRPTNCSMCLALFLVTLMTLSSLLVGVDSGPVVEKEQQTAQCLYENQTFSAGHHFRPDACTHCKCPKMGGEARCSVEDCFAEPNCLKMKKKKNECCGTCLLYGCQHSDGKIYEPGTSVPTHNHCEMCYCPKDGGATICQHRTRCPQVSCVDPVQLEGDCCPRCLAGNNCWVAVDGRKEVMAAGETKTLSDCRQCSCPTGYIPPYLRARGPQAFCTEGDC